MQPDASRARAHLRRGVHTIADLRRRCHVDTKTGCWQWLGCTTGDGLPVLWVPAIERRTSLGIAICVLKTGKLPEKGVVWHVTCATRGCANPAHRTPGTRRTQMLAAGYRPTELARARIAATKRAKSSLSERSVEDIRSSTEPLSVLATRHGISVDHASDIRRGTKRAPLTVPGASVFTWRPAA